MATYDFHWQTMLIALAIIVGTVLLTRIISVLAVRLNNRYRWTTRRTVQKWTRILRGMLFMLALVAALAVLEFQFALALGEGFLIFLSSLFVVLIIWLLGYAIITLLMDLLEGFLLSWASDYLREFEISEHSIHILFWAVKVLLLLVFASISLQIAELDVPVVQLIIYGLLFAVVTFFTVVAIYSFKDQIANFLLTNHIMRNVLRQGQHVRVDGELGEVLTVNTHGAVIGLPSGYKKVIPNLEAVKESFMLKRTRTDVHKLEEITKHYVSQKPSMCGPASIAMMLNFFGYNVDQEAVAKHADIKIRKTKKEKEDTRDIYGTSPEGLVKAVKKITKGSVKGQFIEYRDITDLSKEIKVWLTEGALIVLWYKKPALFKGRGFRTGHYVLCVGVEDNELVCMDPAKTTSGVYMVKSSSMEEAMAEYDKSRGYLVFAKKGSPAYWRLMEGLYYSEVSAYEELSKSLERHLKKAMRKSNVVGEFISPLVELLYEDEESIKEVWKPDIKDKK